MKRARPEVESALAFILEHLGEGLTVARVAKAAGLSEFHLHRVFHETVGESVGRFITRKRLETAALRLVSEPGTPTTTIALDVGYSSPSNFSKAFKGFFGVSPTDARRSLGPTPEAVSKLVQQYGHRPADSFDALASSDDERRAEAARWSACVRYEDLEGLSFVCLASEGGYDLDALEATWAELIDRCRQLGICGAEVDAWGMAHESPDLTAPAFRRYHACIRGSLRGRPPAPLFAKTVAGGRFAVFPYQGPVSGAAAAYRSIYSCWFRHSSLSPDDYVPLDRYVGDAPVDGQVSMEMWFRVRPR